MESKNLYFSFVAHLHWESSYPEEAPGQQRAFKNNEDSTISYQQQQEKNTSVNQRGQAQQQQLLF